jgi:acyl-CoA thioester hydrolase
MATAWHEEASNFRAVWQNLGNFLVSLKESRTPPRLESPRSGNCEFDTTSQETRMSEFTITHRGTVYPWQCDHMGHMNVMWYVAKFDESSWQLLSWLALTRTRFARDGAGMAAVEQRIEYKRELRAGDVVTIRSTVLEVKDKVIRMRHEMTNDDTGDLVAVTELVGVHMEMKARRACSLPSDMRERAILMIKGKDGLRRDESNGLHVGGCRC